MLGVRYRYQAGTRLLLIHHGALIDVEVEGWLGAERGNLHRLKGCGGGKALLVDLNEFNHAQQRFEAAEQFDRVRR